MAKQINQSGNTLGRIITGFLGRIGQDTRSDVSLREQMLEGERIVRAHMAQIRSRLRRAESGYQGSSHHRAARSRHIKAVARRFLKEYRAAIRRDRRFKLERELMDAKFRKIPILDSLVKTRERDWTPVLQRQSNKQYKLDIEGFNFIDRPAETLKCLKNLAVVEGSARTARINFKDEFCKDAGAFLVLAEIWPQMAGVFQGGEMSKSVQKVLNATKVSHHNRMRTPAVEAAKLNGRKSKNDIWAYPMQRRRPAGTSSSSTQHLDQQTREKAADRFSAWVDTCLDESADLKLTLDGRANIALIMGEVLCNAERHSQVNSDDGGWSITAFMVRRDENGIERYECMIAFLSVGQSIAESLNSAAKDIREIQDDYIGMHRQCGRSESTLSTVFALQDTITCDPIARENRSGGTGLQDILDFVSTLGATPEAEAGPRVTIVSGKTCIRLRSPYIRGMRDGGISTKPRLLWFNERNSKDMPPEESFVFDLEDHFAGTLVTVAFNLDAVFLRQQAETGNGGDRSRGIDDGQGSQP